jgi:hypothetical protein
MMLARELTPRTGTHGLRFRDEFLAQDLQDGAAHMEENRVEAAYRRGDLFDKRAN